MPYEWVKRYEEAPERSGASGLSREPLAELRLWPHRSLPPTGFAWVIGITAGLLALPLLAVLGSPVLWGLLPFVVAAVWGLWHALRRNYRDGWVTEVLRLWPDRVRLERTDRNGRREWEANPHWVEVKLNRDGPVGAYLTLRGAGREVEIGAFLSEEERRALWPELTPLFGAGR